MWHLLEQGKLGGWGTVLRVSEHPKILQERNPREQGVGLGAGGTAFQQRREWPMKRRAAIGLLGWKKELLLNGDLSSPLKWTYPPRQEAKENTGFSNDSSLFIINGWKENVLEATLRLVSGSPDKPPWWSSLSTFPRQSDSWCCVILNDILPVGRILSGLICSIFPRTTSGYFSEEVRFSHIIK